MFFGAFIPALRPQFWANLVNRAQANLVLIRDSGLPFLATCLVLYLAFVGYRKVRVALSKA